MAEARRNPPKPTADEVLEWTSTEVVQRIRDGSITAEGYASQLIKRHNEWKEFSTDGTTKVGLDAITQIDEAKVLERAKAIDGARQQGKTLGRLAGLPIVVKENINVAGFRTTAGTPALNDYRPQHDAPVVDAVLKQDAIVLGKVNMDELGRGFTSSNPTYGDTKNPYDVTRISGGGAGGTAAAISARLTPAGLGSDTAGSARVPASFCGIAGLRPSTAGSVHGWTFGSWTITTVNDGVVPIAYAVTTPAPMGRTASDVALLNTVIARHDDPIPVNLEQVRLGVPRGFYWEDVDPEVLRVSEEALDKLRDAGALLLDVNFRKFAQTASPAFNILARMNNLQDLGGFASTNANVTLDAIVKGLANPAIRSRIELSLNQPVPQEQAAAMMSVRPMLALAYQELFRKDNLTAIVYPTVPFPSPKLRARPPAGPGETVADTVTLNGREVNQFNTSLRNTHIAGVVGSPSLVIPAGLTSAGLPVAISLDGWLGDDRSLLGLGLSVQEKLGRLPPPKLPVPVQP